MKGSSTTMCLDGEACTVSVVTRTAALLALAMLFVGTRAEVDAAIDSVQDRLRKEQWRASSERMSCGSRAGFLLGRMCGVPWSYEEAKTRIPFSENGTSFQAIKNGLQCEGVACDIRRMEPSHLLSVRVPAIVLLRHASPAVRVDIGDFVILRAASVHGVSILNPTTAQSFEWPWSYFSDRWSGYGLVQTNCLAPHELQILLFALLCASLFLVGVPVAQARCRPWAAIKGSICTSLFGRRARHLLRDGAVSRGRIVCLLAFAPAFSAPRSVNAIEELRSEHRDGPNAAIVLAALSEGGWHGPYDRDLYPSDVRAESLLDVQKKAAELSCASAIVGISYSELMAMRDPVVLLLRDRQHGKGQFCVVLSARRDAVTILASGPMVVCEMAEDDFRRYWTGHALVPTPSDVAWPYHRACSIALGAALAVISRQALVARGKRTARRQLPIET